MDRCMRSGRCRLQPTAVGRLFSGFTLIELLVVMAVLAILASMVAPRFADKADIARESVLRQDLQGLRVAIDQYYRDKAKYPETLEELVKQRYIRSIPVDPITQRFDSWIVVPPKDGSKSVFDIKSGATTKSRDGSEYASW